MESNGKGWGLMSLVMWIQLALIGASVAALLVLFTWWRKKSFTFHRLVLLTVFFTFDLILFGAFTRLTDSGLGCPDWPGCYGVSNPVMAINHISAAEAAMPTGPVTLSKAWIEMLHRYFAMAVGFLCIVIVIWAWAKKDHVNLKIRILTSFILGLICLQGAFGAWTVTLKLQPIVVTTHLMLGIAFLASLSYLSNLTAPRSNIFKAQGLIAKSGGAWIWFGLMALCIQIFLGAWVSTNYAVLACDDFPLCHGELVPPMDFQAGFSLWRELGKSSDGQFLAIEALRAIHWAHRLGALVVLIILFLVSYKTLKEAITRGHVALRRWAFTLFGLCLLQLMTGMSNIVLDWPIGAALLHTGGAAVMVIVLIKLLMLRSEELV
jgi:cytochrome c oxidase assembly protein subunit 15